MFQECCAIASDSQKNTWDSYFVGHPEPTKSRSVKDHWTEILSKSTFSLNRQVSSFVNCGNSQLVRQIVLRARLPLRDCATPTRYFNWEPSLWWVILFSLRSYQLMLLTGVTECTENDGISFLSEEDFSQTTTCATKAYSCVEAHGWFSRVESADQ